MELINMLKKLFSLIIIAILAISCIPAVSAGTWHLDADGRLVTYFRITDIDTGWTTTKNVAGGDAHDVIVDDSHKNHHVNLQVTYGGVPHPNYHSILIQKYDGSDVKAINGLKYRGSKVYYESWIDFTYQEKTVRVNDSYIL
jgi:hypothetical protein